MTTIRKFLILVRDNRSLIVFMLCLGLFRTAVADWNPIPSGSMRPSLLEGDVVFVNRLSYQVRVPLTDIVVAKYSQPKRGDVVVFASPKDGVRLIKRVIGLPGDVIELRNDVLFINSAQAAYSDPAQLVENVGSGHDIDAVRTTESIAGHTRRIQLLANVDGYSNFGPIAVPADHYWMMGDNRDNSFDSRGYGPVPGHLISGQAVRVLVSADILGNWATRFERFIFKIE